MPAAARAPAGLREPTFLVDRTYPSEHPRFAVHLVRGVSARPLVVLSDWTRSGNVVSIALGVFAQHLRLLDGQRRTSGEFRWLLHYPEVRLSQVARGEVLKLLQLGLQMTPERRAEVVHAIERLLAGESRRAVARATGWSSSRLHQVLGDCTALWRRLRLSPNPFDPFRFGPGLLGGFRLAWDPVSGGYTGAPSPLPPRLAPALHQLLATLRWPAHTMLNLQPEFLAGPTHARDEHAEEDLVLETVFAAPASDNEESWGLTDILGAMPQEQKECIGDGSLG